MGTGWNRVCSDTRGGSREAQLPVPAMWCTRRGRKKATHLWVPGTGVFSTLFCLFKEKNKILSQAAGNSWGLVDQSQEASGSWSAEYGMAYDCQFPSGKGGGDSEGQRSFGSHKRESCSASSVNQWTEQWLTRPRVRPNLHAAKACTENYNTPSVVCTGPPNLYWSKGPYWVSTTCLAPSWPKFTNCLSNSMR